MVMLCIKTLGQQVIIVYHIRFLNQKYTVYKISKPALAIAKAR